MERHFEYPPETIAIFAGVVIVSVYLDLRAHKNAEEVSVRDAALWSIFWVALAMAFYGYLYFHHSSETASLFLGGYVLEESLSVDNLMVFIAVFKNFGIRGALQHRILYYGILGAVIFRLIFVAFGTSVFGLSHWIEFVFAAIVLWTAWKMFRAGDDKGEIADYSNHWSVTVAKKIVPIIPRLVEKQFFVGANQMKELKASDSSLANYPLRLHGTPMLLCLVAIEVTDVLFAVDSVPAVVAVTQEPFLVYSAVIFAILGLRSLYFVLAAAEQKLVHLEKSVIALLVFIAFKLALQASNNIFDWPGFDLSPNVSLAIILGVLALGVIASFADRRPRPAE